MFREKFQLLLTQKLVTYSKHHILKKVTPSPAQTPLPPPPQPPPNTEESCIMKILFLTSILYRKSFQRYIVRCITEARTEHVIV